MRLAIAIRLVLTSTNGRPCSYMEIALRGTNTAIQFWQKPQVPKYVCWNLTHGTDFDNHILIRGLVTASFRIQGTISLTSSFIFFMWLVWNGWNKDNTFCRLKYRERKKLNQKWQIFIFNHRKKRSKSWMYCNPKSSHSKPHKTRFRAPNLLLLWRVPALFCIKQKWYVAITKQNCISNISIKANQTLSVEKNKSIVKVTEN